MPRSQKHAPNVAVGWRRHVASSRLPDQRRCFSPSGAAGSIIPVQLQGLLQPVGCPSAVRPISPVESTTVSPGGAGWRRDADGLSRDADQPWARHEAGLKQVLSRHAVEEVAREPIRRRARWRHPPSAVDATAWHLRDGQRLADAAAGHRRHAVGQVPAHPRSARLRRGQEGAGAQARSAGRCRWQLAGHRRRACLRSGPRHLVRSGSGQGRVAEPARGHPRRRVHRQALPGVGEPARHAPPCRGVCEGQKSFVVLARRWVVERSFGWLTYWGGLLRECAGRLDVVPGRLACKTDLEDIRRPHRRQEAAGQRSEHGAQLRRVPLKEDALHEPAVHQLDGEVDDAGRKDTDASMSTR